MVVLYRIGTVVAVQVNDKVMVGTIDPTNDNIKTVGKLPGVPSGWNIIDVKKALITHLKNLS